VEELKKIYVVPSKGCLIRFPNSREIVPEEGCLVDQDPYWTRRIFMGDVTIKEVSVKNEQVLVHEKKESKKQKVEVRNDD
jgi:hypothetical protein